MSSPSPVVVPRRRRSYAGPIVLITIGVVFLLGNMHVITWRALGFWFARYWPLLIIVWGVVKLVEYYQAQREGTRPSGIGVGGFFLLCFLIISGLIASHAARVDWAALRDEVNVDDEAFPFFGDSYSFNDEMQQAFPPGNSLRVVSDRGNVTVSTWDQDQVKVVVHKRVVADDEEQSKKIDSQTRPTISVTGTLVTVNANTLGAGEHGVATDLDIFVPKAASVDVATRRGDVTVHGRSAAVKLASNHGDISVADLKGNANINIHNGSLNAADILGTVVVDGRLDDAHVSNVSGNLTMTGDYFGDVTLAKISKSVTFKSSRTEMAFANLQGELTMESGDLRAKAMAGPVTLLTKSKDIHLDDVTGDIRLEDSNGSIEVHADKLPLGNIRISNSKGDVQIVVPAQASFTVEARTRNGNIETDFDQVHVNSGNDEASATGAVGSSGPRVEINTEHGDIEIRKAG